MSATILLADDSPTIQKVVELTFAETDYQVVAVSGGNELLARLPEVQPDVVICDVIMPDRDGYDVCQTIKSSPETLHIPVVLLTGTFEPFDRDRALAVGCDEIVTKPFEARQLIATVEKLVAGGGVEEEAAAPLEEEEFGTYLVAPPEAQGEGAAAEAATAGEAPAAPESPAVAESPAPEEGVATEPPAGFGSMDEIPEEGLDFTTSGFAEMEAAGQQPHVPMEPPAEGIEIEDAEPLEIPVPERQEAEAAPFADEPPAPVETPFGGEHGEAEQGPGEPPAAPSPSDTAPVEAEPPAWDAGEPEAASPAMAGEPEAPAPEAEEAVAEPAPETPPAPAVAAVPTPEEPSAPEVPAASPAPAPGGALSDEDVERIARRVVELYAESLERIAWEVLPDMAEIVVRERVREIEAEIEGEGAPS